VEDLGLICAGGRMWGKGCVSVREIQGDKNCGGKFSRGQMRYRASGRMYGEVYCFRDFAGIVLVLRDFGVRNVGSGEWVQNHNIFDITFLDPT
jgi:hypothetical protein